MKINGLKYISAPMIIGVAFLSGCGGLGKMIKEYPKVSYSVTPVIPEVHGGKVAVSISGNIPEKYFHKKVAVTFTPVLKYEGGETALKSMSLIGEAAPGEGTKIMNLKGGKFNYTDTIVYKPEMKKSELHAKVMAAIGTKTPVSLGERKLADACITTSLRVQNEEELLLAKDQYVKESIISKSGEMYFPIQQSTIPEKEKNSNSMKDLKAFTALKYKTKKVSVTAYASPDGPIELNDKLSGGRSDNGLGFIKNQLKALKLDGAADDQKYERISKGEYWDGFVKLVNESSLDDKQLIVNLVNSHADVNKREQEIKNLAVVYKKLASDILPKLRKAEILIESYEPKKTDAEMDSIAAVSPDSLTAEELLYASTLTEDWDKKMKIYEAHSRVYPNDWRGFNNAAYVHLWKKNLGDAATWLEKAKAIKPTAEVMNNLGVLAVWNGDYQTAMTHYEDSKSKGGNVNHNMGAINIRWADYPSATEQLGSHCSHNAALVKLLTGNVQGASQAADCAKEQTGALHYLKAVISARNNDKEGVVTNLKKAVEAEASCRKDAITDLEFSKFWDSPDFKNAIQ